MRLRVAKVVWLFLAVAPLVRALRWAEGKYHGEALEFLVGVLMAMGFPSSLPVLGVMTLTTWTLRHFGIEVAATRSTYVAAWAVLIVTGYLQWFVLVPRIVRWFKDPGPEAAVGSPPGGAEQGRT